MIADKVKYALAQGLNVIYCIGESAMPLYIYSACGSCVQQRELVVRREQGHSRRLTSTRARCTALQARSWRSARRATPWRSTRARCRCAGWQEAGRLGRLASAACRRVVPWLAATAALAARSEPPPACLPAFPFRLVLILLRRWPPRLRPRTGLRSWLPTSRSGPSAPARSPPPSRCARASLPCSLTPFTSSLPRAGLVA